MWTMFIEHDWFRMRIANMFSVQQHVYRLSWFQLRIKQKTDEHCVHTNILHHLNSNCCILFYPDSNIHNMVSMHNFMLIINDDFILEIEILRTIFCKTIFLLNFNYSAYIYIPFRKNHPIYNWKLCKITKN